VRDDVVHLGGQPGPLVGSGLRGAEVLLAFCPGRAIEQRVHEPAASGQVHTDQGGNTDQDEALVVFLALPVLCFVLAVRFMLRPGQRLWAAYSAATGVAVLALIQGLGVEGYGGLYQRLTIAVGWGWLAALALWLRGPRRQTSPYR
jgi:hypothetical protein